MGDLAQHVSHTVSVAVPSTPPHAATCHQQAINSVKIKSQHNGLHWKLLNFK